MRGKVEEWVVGLRGGDVTRVIANEADIINNDKIMVLKLHGEIVFQAGCDYVNYFWTRDIDGEVEALSKVALLNRLKQAKNAIDDSVKFYVLDLIGEIEDGHFDSIDKEEVYA